MADELPEPKSRKESYLAKAAGMDVTIPEKPESRLEQYLDAIAEGGGGGGGGSYTAGDGIDITNNTISVDTDTIQEKLTAGDGIDITDNTISTTGGGGPTVVQTTGTSTTDVMSQDATTKMIYSNNGANSLPTQITIGKGANNYASSSVVIGESANISSSGGVESIAIGHSASIADRETICIGHQARSRGSYNTNIGYQAGFGGSSNAKYNTYLGYSSGGASNSNKYSVALGYGSYFTRDGEVNIRAGDTTHGFNNTSYRVLGGVYDGQDAHDAVTVEQVNTTIDAINTALSVNIPHIGATS